jgi:aryl-alcohol dehydrogenase-like predicted oxidoreductase
MYTWTNWIEVSVLGLGGGGHSRLGQASGSSAQQSVALVQRALDLGINFIDTAEAYGTEAIIGQGFTGTTRDQVFALDQEVDGEPGSPHNTG